MNFLYKKSQFSPKKWAKMSFPDHGVNKKVVNNVENYLNMQFQPKLMTHSGGNSQKPIFIYKKWQIFDKYWVKISFPDHGVNRKVVDNVENYLNMQFQPKVMTHSRVNGQKTIFWKIVYKKNECFPGKSGFVTFLHL